MDTYQVRYSIGTGYLRRLSLFQRILRLLYLKYVYEPEKIALIEELPKILKEEQAMIEKEWYARSSELH